MTLGQTRLRIRPVIVFNSLVEFDGTCTGGAASFVELNNGRLTGDGSYDYGFASAGTLICNGGGITNLVVSFGGGGFSGDVILLQLLKSCCCNPGRHEFTRV